MSAIDFAGSIVSSAARRVEVAAENVANIITPGYKSSHAFAQLLTGGSIGNADAAAKQADDVAVDFSPGKMQSTGNPFDLAISGHGFFVVTSPDGTFYTRDGQFVRDAEGRLVTADGMALQSSSGDVVVDNGKVQVMPDGTVLDGGEPVARLTIADFDQNSALRPAGGTLFETAAVPNEVASPVIRQGMLEASNVSAADEMTSIMRAMRSAEQGQQMVQAYSDLLDRAATEFGRAS